jgi:endonuclease YncB( thermonuclease family)
MKDDYVRSATVVRVLDGDTVILDVDLGFYMRARMSCRLAGINAPEHNQPGGPEAKAALTELLSRGDVTVRSVHADKYAGRFDAYVVIEGSVWTVNAMLVQQGYAVMWDGTGPRPTVPWPRAEAAT